MGEAAFSLPSDSDPIRFIEDYDSKNQPFARFYIDPDCGDREFVILVRLSILSSSRHVPGCCGLSMVHRDAIGCDPDLLLFHSHP